MNSAAEHGHVTVVKYLHEHRREGCTGNGIIAAASNGDVNVIQFLYEHCPDAWIPDALNYACGFGHLAVVQFIIKKEGVGTNQRDQCIGTATANGHFPIVKYLQTIPEHE